MVEIIPAEEMSVYDRLRAELLARVDQLAGQAGYDTLDDEDDYDVDDEDWDTPLTPHEYSVMYEEYLKENPDVGDVKEADENTADPTTAADSPHESGDASASNAE